MKHLSEMAILKEMRIEIERQIPLKSEITSLGGGLVVLYGPAILPILDSLTAQVAEREKTIEKMTSLMKRAANRLDRIKYDLDSSVYTLEDDEFETVFCVRDEIQLYLFSLSGKGESNE